MCRKLLFLLAVFFLIARPTAGQREEIFFSLSTTKTFLPGEKINLRLYAHGVSALEFRVYRVNDPTQFFERLDNVHGFGFGFGGYGQREIIETPTFLERFHDWKLNTWFEIRDFFRTQYSPRSRAFIREAANAPRKPAPINPAVFAQVPLLNESQLVARWRQDTPSRYLSESNVMPIDSLTSGVYLIEATDGTLRAYTIAIVSNIGLITKSAPGQVLAFVADRKTGEPIPGATVIFWAAKQQVRSLPADRSGLIESALPTGRIEDVRILAVTSLGRGSHDALWLQFWRKSRSRTDRLRLHRPTHLSSGTHGALPSDSADASR